MRPAPCSSSATSAGVAAVEVDACPDLEIQQRQQAVGAVDAVGLVRRDQRARSRRSGTGRAPRSTSGDSNVAQQRRELALEPRAHRRAEAALLAVRGCRAAAGRASAAFITCFSAPPRILTSAGMRAASSTSSWSSSGTRHSSDTAMLILSVSSSRSSGSCVSASTANMRFSASSPSARAKAAASASPIAPWLHAAAARATSSSRKTSHVGPIALLERQTRPSRGSPWPGASR